MIGHLCVLLSCTADWSWYDEHFCSLDEREWRCVSKGIIHLSHDLIWDFCPSSCRSWDSHTSLEWYHPSGGHKEVTARAGSNMGRITYTYMHDYNNEFPHIILSSSLYLIFETVPYRDINRECIHVLCWFVAQGTHRVIERNITMGDIQKSVKENRVSE